MGQVVTLSPSILTTVSAKESPIVKSKDALWNELEGALHVPSGHDDGGIRSRKRAETKHM